jgi:hypothetical protein
MPENVKISGSVRKGIIPMEDVETCAVDAAGSVIAK